MLLFSRPSRGEIENFLARARESSYSYPETGATSGPLPPGYVCDRNRVLLGRGPEDWRKGTAALRAWKMFELGWVSLCWPSTPISVGENVAVLAHYLNGWWLNGCRIVYVVEEEGKVERFGFAYGTLLDHAESGEERFTVEWNQETGDVYYDILAFSRPNQILTRIGYPLARKLQKKFAADSKAAMLRAVGR